MKYSATSVGLPPSDDLFMRDDGRRFGDGMSLWHRIEYGTILLFYRSPGNLHNIVPIEKDQFCPMRRFIAYNQFQSGFVRTVFVVSFGHRYLIQLTGP